MVGLIEVGVTESVRTSMCSDISTVGMPDAGEQLRNGMMKKGRHGARPYREVLGTSSDKSRARSR